MLNSLKKLLSYIVPIPLGTSTTIDDQFQTTRALFKDKLDKRLNRTTAKFMMVEDFNFYELANVTIDPKTNLVQYHLEHCATNSVMVVSEDVFKFMFMRK